MLLSIFSHFAIPAHLYSLENNCHFMNELNSCDLTDINVSGGS